MNHSNIFVRLFYLLVSAGLTIGLANSCLAASDGAQLAADKCDACHGKNGNSEKEDVPSIAGFSEVVLEDSFDMYKSGERKGGTYKVDGKETNMNEIAKALSPEDIEALSVFYSEQTFQPRQQKFDAALAEKGAAIHESKCENCHSEQGSNADDDAAILAGQWSPYLLEQCHAFRSGDREPPSKMKKKIDDLSDEEIEALVNFYASQQ
jgi:cytochrome subunit of sulfide dehydrogenase